MFFFRVQQEGKEEIKLYQTEKENVEQSPKGQLRGFLNSPRSLKQFCSSKSTVSPKMSIDRTSSLNPSELLEPKKSLKSPSRLDIRRLSKELFSLPWSAKSSASLEIQRPSSDVEENKDRKEITKTNQMPEFIAKDIRSQASKTIGRRLSKDVSSWLTTSPPDLSSRRKSYMDIIRPKSLSVSDNILDGNIKSKMNVSDSNFNILDQTKTSDYAKELCAKSTSLNATISKAATLRLASSGSTNVPKTMKVRPRLPSPTKSPVLGFRGSQTPKISISDVDNCGLYETIKSKNEPTGKKPTRGLHSRSKSLDNKNLNFETKLVDILSAESSSSQIVSYTTLEHKDDEDLKSVTKHSTEKLSKSASNEDNNKKIKENRQDKKMSTSPSIVKMDGIKSKELSLSVKNKTDSSNELKVNTCSKSKDIMTSIYAEPQKIKKSKNENLTTHVQDVESHSSTKPKVSPKRNALKLKQTRACSAPETDTGLLSPSVFLVSDETIKTGQSSDYNYYSDDKVFKTFSYPCYDTSSKRLGGVSSPRDREHNLMQTHRRPLQESSGGGGGGGGNKRIQVLSGRSRSVPEQHCLLKFSDYEKEKQCNRSRYDGPQLVLQHFSRSLDMPSTKSRENFKNKRKSSKSKGEDDFPPTLQYFKEMKSRNGLSNEELLNFKKSGQRQSEPP